METHIEWEFKEDPDTVNLLELCKSMKDCASFSVDELLRSLLGFELQPQSYASPSIPNTPPDSASQKTNKAIKA